MQNSVFELFDFFSHKLFIAMYHLKFSALRIRTEMNTKVKMNFTFILQWRNYNTMKEIKFYITKYESEY